MQAADTVLTITVNPPIPVVDTTDSRVTVSATQIVTPDDVIPIPQTGLRLVIPAGETLVWDQVDDTWDQVDDTRYDAVLIYGTLRFARNVPTRLRCTTLIVFPNGTLDAGTDADPMPASTTCEIIVNDVPLDPANDPGQYWNGFICFGTVTMVGAPKVSYLRLAKEPKSGDTTLILGDSPMGWEVGDSLIVADSRQLLDTERWTKFIPQWEVVKIAGIAGNVVSLVAPLKYDHPAAYNKSGAIEFLPHVGNLTRNVVIKSDNPSGTRGHVFLSRRAHVQLKRVQFGGLGRVRNAAADATNVDNRFALNLHHLFGPLAAKDDPSLFPVVEDCSVFCPLDPMPFRWGVMLGDTHYATIRRNTIYNWAGAGMVWASNCTGNNIEDNFVVGVRGDTNPRDNNGRDGVGYWGLNFNNMVCGNIAASVAGSFQGIVAGSGFNLFGPAATTKTTKIPKFPGADPAVDFVLVDRQLQPLLEFDSNESYGCMATGFTLWQLGTDGYSEKPGAVPSVMTNSVAWHCWEEGFFGYPTANLTIDGFTVIGDKKCLAYPVHGGQVLTTGDYRTVNLTLKNVRGDGLWYGIRGSCNLHGTFEIVNPDLNIKRTPLDIPMFAVPGAGGSTGPCVTSIRNPKITATEAGRNKISRSYGDPNTLRTNYVGLADVYVYDMDGTPGDNFEVFLTQQAADFITPKSGEYPSCVGSPEAGLTNEQNLAKYNLCISGKLLPAAAVDRAGIGGKVLQGGV